MSKEKLILPKPKQIDNAFWMVIKANDRSSRQKLALTLAQDTDDSIGMCLRTQHPYKNVNILHVIACGQADFNVLEIIWPYMNIEMYNYKGEQGNTPLMAAISNGQQEVFQELLHFQRKKLNFLEFSKSQIKHELKHTVNIFNDKLQTPLHFAVINNNIEQIKNLLELGANPRARDNEGNTPAHLAAKHPFTFKEALMIFAAVFGDPLLKNNKGKTVLDTVLENSSFEAEQSANSKDAFNKVSSTWVNAKLNITHKKTYFEPVQNSGSKKYENKDTSIFMDDNIQEIINAFKKPQQSFQDKLMQVGNRMSFREL